MIPKAYAHNFDQMEIALKRGDLALMECQDAKTGRIVCVIVMCNRQPDDGVQFIPVARMLDGNPFKGLNPPDEEGTGFVTDDGSPGPKIRIGEGERLHAVEVHPHKRPDSVVWLDVEADNSKEAAAFAKEYGYTVLSVSLVH